MIRYKAIHGLCGSGLRWCDAPSAKLRIVGFTPSKADADLWFKDKDDHCECIDTCVDDPLVWSRNPMELISIFEEDFQLKGVGVLDYYLGVNIDFLGEQWTKENVNLGFSSKTHIENLTSKFERLFNKTFKSIKMPMDEAHHPETDDYPLVSVMMMLQCADPSLEV